MAPPPPPPTNLNPKTTHYEFSGLPGAAGITFGLPVVCYLLYLACHDGGCLTLRPVRHLAAVFSAGSKNKGDVPHD